MNSKGKNGSNLFMVELKFGIEMPFPINLPYFAKGYYIQVKSCVIRRLYIY